MLTHSVEKRFKCDQCNYSGNQAGHLKNHMLQHSGEKPFACNQCNFSCRDSSNLKRHMLLHTNEKPFACKKCDYSCKQSVHLRSHMKKHTRELSTPGHWFTCIILNLLLWYLIVFWQNKRAIWQYLREDLLGGEVFFRGWGGEIREIPERKRFFAVDPFPYRGLWSLRAGIMIIFEVMTDTQTYIVQFHL